MIKRWAFIYFSPGSDPSRDRIETERAGLHTTLVPVPELAAAGRIAAELVDGGAELIELCGVFGPVWAAKVIEATGGRVPIGHVSFGAESVPGLAAAIA